MPENKAQQDDYHKTLGSFLHASAPKPGNHVDALLQEQPGRATVELPGGSTPLLAALQAGDLGNPWMTRKILVTVLLKDNDALKAQWKIAREEAEKEYRSSFKYQADTKRPKPGQLWAGETTHVQALAEQKLLDWAGAHPESISKEALAYFNHKNAQEQSALSLATGKMPEAAAFLLRAGVETTQLDSKGNNVLHVLAQHDNPAVSADFVEALKQRDCKALLQETNKGIELPVHALANPVAARLFIKELGVGKDAGEAAMRARVNDLFEAQEKVRILRDEKVPLAADQVLKLYHQARNAAAGMAALSEAGIAVGESRAQVLNHLGELTQYTFGSLQEAFPAIDSTLFPAYAARIEPALDKQAKAFLDEALRAVVDPKKAGLLNQKDAEGNTPLFYAMKYKRFDDASALLQEGAAVTGLTRAEDNIYHLVAQYADKRFLQSPLADALKARKDNAALLGAENKERFSIYVDEIRPTLPASKSASGEAAEFFLSLDKSIFSKICPSGPAEHIAFTRLLDGPPCASLMAICNQVQQKAPDDLLFISAGDTRLHQFLITYESSNERTRVYSGLLTQTTNKYLEQVKQAGADHPDAREWRGRAAVLADWGLRRVCYEGDMELLESIKAPIAQLKKAGVPIKYSNMNFARVVEHGNMDVIREAVELGVPLNDVGALLAYADRLEHPAQKDKNARALMQFLQEKGAEVTQDERGALPIDAAIQRGDLAAVKRYCDYDFVYPKAYTPGKQATPLDLAMQKFHKEGGRDDTGKILQQMIEYEAKRNAPKLTPQAQSMSISLEQALAAQPQTPATDTPPGTHGR